MRYTQIKSEEIKELIRDISFITREFKYASLMRILLGILNLTPENLKSSSRKNEIVMQRHMFTFIFYGLSRVSLQTIGSWTNKHHSTVLHSVQLMIDYVNMDKEYEEKVINILKRVDEKITRQTK